MKGRERDVGDRSVLILISIVFAVAAGWVAQLILGRSTNWGEAIVPGLIGSIAGAVVVLAIWGAVRSRAAKGACR
jgi:uncharacterized membrane protein YeaQ/YmgE (transglycosylase-associated protein family)